LEQYVDLGYQNAKAIVKNGKIVHKYGSEYWVNVLTEKEI